MIRIIFDSINVFRTNIRNKLAFLNFLISKHKKIRRNMTIRNFNSIAFYNNSVSTTSTPTCKSNNTITNRINFSAFWSRNINSRMITRSTSGRRISISKIRTNIRIVREWPNIIGRINYSIRIIFSCKIYLQKRKDNKNSNHHNT